MKRGPWFVVFSECHPLPAFNVVWHHVRSELLPERNNCLFAVLENEERRPAVIAKILDLAAGGTAGEFSSVAACTFVHVKSMGLEERKREEKRKREKRKKVGVNGRERKMQDVLRRLQYTCADGQVG